MTKPIDWTKPVQTRDGREVWLVRNEKGEVHRRKGIYPIVGLLNNCAEAWAPDGSFILDSGENADDLINVPEPVEFMLSVHPDGRAHTWHTYAVNCFGEDWAKLRVHNTGGTWQVEPVK